MVDRNRDMPYKSEEIKRLFRAGRKCNIGRGRTNNRLNLRKMLLLVILVSSFRGSNFIKSCLIATQINAALLNDVNSMLPESVQTVNF